MPSLTRHVAIVVEATSGRSAELATVAAALQLQVTRDFAPIWEIRATVDGFTSLDDVPISHWPIIVSASVDDPSEEGYHRDRSNQPFAVVKADDSWSLTASHECLEMIADPFGNRLVAGPSVDPNNASARVRYLLEVCDPCQDSANSYTINGVVVSDFITPYYHSPSETKGLAYSFTGAITAPRQVLVGGYLSFEDTASGSMYQAVNAGTGLQIVALDTPESGTSLREHSHACALRRGLQTAAPRAAYHADADNLRIARQRRDGATAASKALAERLRRAIRP